MKRDGEGEVLTAREVREVLTKLRRIATVEAESRKELHTTVEQLVELVARALGEAERRTATAVERIAVYVETCGLSPRAMGARIRAKRWV